MSLHNLILSGVLSVSLTACITVQDKSEAAQASSSAQSKRQKMFDHLDSESQIAITVVKNYLEAYSRRDVTAMAEFYPEDVKFSDPTSEHTPFAPSPSAIDNKDDLLVIMKQLPQFYEAIEYNIDRIWESSGYVVVVADFVATLKTANGGVPLPSQIVNVFKVEDGKITEFRDYFDYNEAFRHYPG